MFFHFKFNNARIKILRRYLKNTFDVIKRRKKKTEKKIPRGSGEEIFTHH